ncbi:unnamed protein product [Owenia fusiformis]|uniref:G-protein coupled receptors family 1 profile domain-containing protein n=1 Tax=Owenia fusiformis TaxID=6347 RepID=A0A8S4ND20_OWEFU|nr:unnamed protein product [Owenia fusiformis]
MATEDPTSTLAAENISTDVTETFRLSPLLPRNYLIAHAVFESIIAVLIVGGNSIVLISILIHKNLHTVNNLFLTSLAVADLIMGIFVSPLTIHILYVKPLIYVEHTQDKWSCVIRLYLLTMSFGASLFSICGIALDRYIAIIHPLKYRSLMTRRRVMVYILCFWVYVISTCAYLFSEGNIQFKAHETCRTKNVVSPLVFSVLKIHTFVAIFVSVMSHSVVAMVAAKHRARINSQLVRFNNNMAVAHRNENKIAKTMTLVVGLFLLCWLPSTINSLIKRADSPDWDKSLSYYLVALMVANSAVNPWIYGIGMKKMRKAMLNVMQCSMKRSI